MPLHDRFEIFDVDFEITTQNGIRVSSVTAPRMMLEQQFLSLVREAATILEPVKVKMKRTIPIYSQFDNCWYDRECSVEFTNYAYTRSHGEAT